MNRNLGRWNIGIRKLLFSFTLILVNALISIAIYEYVNKSWMDFPFFILY